MEAIISVDSDGGDDDGGACYLRECEEGGASSSSLLHRRRRRLGCQEGFISILQGATKNNDSVRSELVLELRVRKS